MKIAAHSAKVMQSSKHAVCSNKHQANGGRCTIYNLEGGFIYLTNISYILAWTKYLVLLIDFNIFFTVYKALLKDTYNQHRILSK